MDNDTTPSEEKLMQAAERMRYASGEVTCDSKLVAFLYVLIRDHVTPGQIEEVMVNHIDDKPSLYSNGWLANYAIDVASRLR